MDLASYYHMVNNIPDPVHSIVQTGTLLVISSGNVVQLVKQGTIGLIHFFTLFATRGDKIDW